MGVTTPGERFRLFLGWLRITAIATSGGWLLFVAFARWAPIWKLIEESGGRIGFFLGFLFAVGTAVSSLIYWLVTGKNAVNAIFGFRDLDASPAFAGFKRFPAVKNISARPPEQSFLDAIDALQKENRRLKLG